MNNIISLWPTNVVIEKPTEVTQKFVNEIIAIGEEYEAQHPEAHVPYHMRKTPEVAYNLLIDERPACQLFKSILKSRMYQLAIAEGFNEPDKLEFEATTNLRKFAPGEYAKPHNHRSVDYVAVLWLSMDITDIPGTKTNQKMVGNRFHMIDPIAARNRQLNHNMLFPVSPYPGLFMMHTASVFHTTEANLGSVDTVALVTNIKIIESVRNYIKL